VKVISQNIHGCRRAVRAVRAVRAAAGRNAGTALTSLALQLHQIMAFLAQGRERIARTAGAIALPA
jgi:hypothetical protein